MAAGSPAAGSMGQRWRRRGVTSVFLALVAFELLMPLTGLVARWRDGDGHGHKHYSWHMYSTLDKYRGN